MELLVAEVVQLFYTLLWPMIRISAFLLTAPFFSIQAVTVRIRVLLALLLKSMSNPRKQFFHNACASLGQKLQERQLLVSL